MDYLNALRSDIDVLRYHIKYAFQNPDDMFDVETPIQIKNDIIFKLLGINNKFAETKLFKEFKNNLIRGFVRNLRKGHLLISGTYATLFGNPIEMLQQSIGKFGGDTSIHNETVFCRKFKHGEQIVGSRSPHICSGDVLLTTNFWYPSIEKYFNLSDEIVCINSIRENIGQRLQGSDFDGDAILLTNNHILIDAAKKNYSKFAVPVNKVNTKKLSRVYNNTDKADLDIKTSVNKIGEIVNLSQASSYNSSQSSFVSPL